MYREAFDSSQKKTIFITGISGFLGYKMAMLTRNQYNVVGNFYKHPLKIPKAETLSLRLSDAMMVERVLDTYKPEVIFHLAAISNPNICEKEPSLSYAANVTATRNLVAAAKKHHIKVVFTSSDLVFDGLNAPYDETAQPSPVNLYGIQKLESEKAVLDYDHGIVCRMPLMFGEKSQFYGSFLQPMVQFLLAHEDITLFADEFRTPLSSQRAVEGLLLMAGQSEKLVHLAGNTSVNRYELGLKIAEMLGTGTSHIKKHSLHDFVFPAKRPPDTSMKNDLAKSLGFQPGDLFADLAQVIQTMKP
jgi:dTDP-4-dehydrorhamnose reductase